MPVTMPTSENEIEPTRISRAMPNVQVVMSPHWKPHCSRISGTPMATTTTWMRMESASPIWSSTPASILSRPSSRRPSAEPRNAPSLASACADRWPIYMVARIAPVTTICCDMKRASPI